MRTLRWEIAFAWRYLFSKKGHNAINIVSGVSAAAVAVVTAAMVVVLSVMNGFGSLVGSMLSNFDPELKITATQGKNFTIDNDTIRQLRQLSYVEAISEVVDEIALVQYRDSNAYRLIDHQVPAHVMGVDDHFRHVSQVEEVLIDGKYMLYDGAFQHAVVGRGLASQLEVGIHFRNNWLRLYAPKRSGQMNMVRQDQNFRDTLVLASSVFSVGQTQYDDQVMLVSLPLARQLFGYESNRVTALYLRLNDHSSARQKDIQALLGPAFTVANRYQQQADFYHILEIEKWLTLLLMLFILMIAGFNVIGSLTMLILDKKENIQTLHHLGAGRAQIQRIFLLEGWLISTVGMVLGLLLGIGLCWIQEQFGLLKLGSGTEYIIAAYPVQLQATDIALVALLVLTLGFLAAWIPARKIK